MLFRSFEQSLTYKSSHNDHGRQQKISLALILIRFLVWRCPMILSLLTTSCGFYFVSRFHQQLSKFFPFLTSKKLFFHTLIGSFFAFCFHFLHQKPLVLWITTFLFWMASEFFMLTLKSLMERRLKETALEFIDQCCLSTSVGNSFRNSMQKVFIQRNDWCAIQFKNLAQSLVTSDKIMPQTSSFLSDFKQELMQIDRSGQKMNEQLKILRRILKIEINFRRKSGQVLRNLQIQSLVLTFLYIGFIFFISSQIDLFRYKRLLFFSMVLFVFGLILTFVAGRRIKWKV